MTFVIDADNNITAYAADTAPAGAELKLSEHPFGSEKELANLAGTWRGARLIEIWNSLPGATPVKKFTDRKKAVARIWKSIKASHPYLKPNRSNRLRRRKRAGPPLRVRRISRSRPPRPRRRTNPPHRATVARKPSSWRFSDGRAAQP